MDPSQFFATFRQLHQKAKVGTLDAQDRQKYAGMCEEFARSLMRAQGQSIEGSAPARRQLRVAHVFQVEVANLYRTMTRELSCTGFTAVVQGALAQGEQVSWVLTPSRSLEPISGSGRVTSAAKLPAGGYRLSCAFDKLDEARLERLELAVFDAALARVG